MTFSHLNESDSTMNQGGCISPPSPCNEHCQWLESETTSPSLHCPQNDVSTEDETLTDIDTRLGKKITEKVVIQGENDSDTENEQEIEKTIMNGHIDVINLRVKKQKISTAITSSDQERPMSWEGELSDDDILSNDNGAKTPSTLTEESNKPPSILTLEPGSPMSVNDSDKEEGMVQSNKLNSDVPHLKPVSPFPARSHVHSPVQPRPLGGPVHPLPGHDLPNQASHYFTPQASPLQARHVNGHSYSSSSSPELAKHLFYSPNQSPVQSRHITSVGSYSQSPSPRHVITQETSAPYSPNQSPVQSRHVTSQDSPYSSPYSSVGSPSGSSSIPFSPNQSPVQGRHPQLASGSTDTNIASFSSKTHLPSHLPGPPNELPVTTDSSLTSSDGPDEKGLFCADLSQHSALAGQAGISRQQLINSPCPICGDKISGFHYGIFSCESCKGFFKRTVQNKKNYLCLRGAACPVAVATRKKCPACRFDKCLKMGMKLEAIREDRTRGGRSTYQCSYSLPSTMLSSTIECKMLDSSSSTMDGMVSEVAEDLSSRLNHNSEPGLKSGTQEPVVPDLIQEIMSVEHLWHYNESEAEKVNEQHLVKVADRDPDFFSNIADHRLYKIVKWCKSLPLFRNIQIDDQICLLLNSWCELLLLSCCFRSMPTPDEIRVSHGKSLNLPQARMIGLGPVIERMINLTEHLRRLRVDQYEYVCLKVIILLTSDISDLKEPEAVRQSQEKVIQALQTYSLSHYPQHPSKFGELLLRIPELQRTCLIGKESLSIKHREGEMPSFNLLMELLRGEH